MEYRTLGGTGTIVSTLCLGTMTFGKESSEEVSHAQLDRFVEAGGNFVDTANVYSRGGSEEVVGRWLAARSGVRDRLVLATKGRFPMGDDPNSAGLTRVNLSRALDASLRRLGVETIDLYQAHAWDPLTPIEETLAFFDDAVRAGKIRYAASATSSAGSCRRRRCSPSSAGSPRSSPCSRSTTCWSGRSSSSWSTCAATRTSASCPGHRWAAAGSPASTSGTVRRPAPPGSARTRPAGWRR